MAYKISSDCINCGACESECPAEAISDNGTQRVIAEDKCVSCGSCSGVCPAGAITEG